MGACDFKSFVIGRFETVEDAFNSAVDKALYAHGHGGYTGTIAEKSMDGFKPAPVPIKTRDVLEWYKKHGFKLIDQCDKWGPCLYIEVKNKSLLKRLKEKHGLKGRKGIRAFIFFGIAPC